MKLIPIEDIEFQVRLAEQENKEFKQQIVDTWFEEYGMLRTYISVFRWIFKRRQND